MIVIYYSHAYNTERFVHKRLAPLLKPSAVFRAHARGPHADLERYTTPYIEPLNELTPEDFFVPHSIDVLFITPTYGKFNHELHKAENYTPKPMQQAMNQFFDSRHPADTDYRAYYAVGGNRTFGRDFCVQDFIHPNLEGKRVGNFELSGSDTDAEEIIARIKTGETAR